MSKNTLCILVFSIVFCTLSSAQIASDFSGSADSWTAFDNNSGSTTSVTYNAAGGNPGGYISFTTSAGYVPIYWTAPSKFLSNQSRSYNKTLTFDMLQSTTGTDNTQSDVWLVGGGVNLVYQLPTKPGTSWTSYSIPLNETQWHNGCPTCSAPTQSQMKAALANITKLQIRLKYLSGNTFPYTAQLDNVVLNQIPVGTPPVITSFTPTSALAGATVIITGSNFGATVSENIVYFHGIKGVVTNATATELKVTVPTSAAFGPITVVNLTAGQQASSVQSFNPLFDNNKDFGGQIIPASMSRGYNIVLPMSSSASNGFGRMDKGDLDGDGKIDLVTTETSTAKIYAFRNLGSGGSLSASSFGSAITLPTLTTIPGGPSVYLSEVVVTDVDSDGLLDVAASVANNSTGHLAVYRNTSTSGNISFAAPVFFAYNYYSSLSMATGDLDGDGRTDFAFTTGTSPGNIFISQNLSTPGNIDFSFGGNISASSTSGLSDIVIGDLTGDGKPEIVCPGYNAATLSIYQNNSSPGTISMGTVFTIPASVSYTNQLVMADFDADNKLDMAWSTYGAQYIYFVKNNYSGGTFDATSFGSTLQVANTLSNPLGITAGDINGDNKPDIVVSGYNDIAILQNVGSASSLNSNSFLSTTLFQGGASGSIFALSPVLADLDGDNKSEAIFVSSGGGLPAGATGIYIFHNESFPVPSVSSVSPSSATAGASVSLNGDLMFTGNVNPSIRLNDLLANLNGTATNTTTLITNPTAAISGKFTITNHGLTGTSSYFKKTFGTTKVINSSSFEPSVDFALGANTRDALEVADFDDDGKTDVIVVDNYSTTKILQNSSTAGQAITASSLTLQTTTYTGGYNIIALDIDGDGKTDLNNGYGLLQNNSASNSISFIGGPNGVYTYSGGFNYAAVADFNKDGKLDLAVTNGTANIQVYENKSSRGTFVNNSNLSTYSTNAISLAKPNNYGGVVAEDFDGDGYEDIISTNQSANTFTYYLNAKAYGDIKSTSFTLAGNDNASGSQPVGLTADDFDGDGKIDIAITYANSAFISVHRNISSPGTISFASGVTFTSANKGYNITSQDLDGDGKAEIVVIHRPNPSPGSFSIFQNSSTSGTISFNTVVNYPLTSPARNPQAVAIADINQDQKPDILIVGDPYGTGTNALMVFENKIASITISVTTAPVDASVCNGTTTTFIAAASGTTNIAYQWQFSTSSSQLNFTDIVDNTNYSGAATASLSVNTTGNFGAGRYRCKINGDFVSTLFTNDAGLTVNTVTPPVTTGSAICSGTTATLTATGATNGQYRWYTTATGGTAINGEVNSSFTTPIITAATTYYASINTGTCESTRSVVNVTLLTSGCTPSQPSSPPVIDTVPLATQVEGKIVLDLVPLITTTGTLDINSIQLKAPLTSGALATITNGVLTIDYQGKKFSGEETITIEACNTDGSCSQQAFDIEVAGDVVVYNAVSPNGDDKNDQLFLQYIDVLPDTKENKVTIFNRWGDVIFEVQNYNNTDKVFKGVSKEGKELASGTYYYKIDFTSGHGSQTGFLYLKR